MRFSSTVELVNALEQGKAQDKAGKIAEILVKIDSVIPGAPGYLPFSASGGALPLHRLSTLREYQFGHHHQPEFRRVRQRLRHRQDDQGLLARLSYHCLIVGSSNDSYRSKASFETAKQKRKEAAPMTTS